MLLPKIKAERERKRERGRAREGEGEGERERERERVPALDACRTIGSSVASLNCNIVLLYYD